MESHKSTGVVGSLALMDGAEHLASLRQSGYGYNELYDECGQYGWTLSLVLDDADAYHLVVKQGQQELPGMKFRSARHLATYSSVKLTTARLDDSARRLRVRMTAVGLFTPEVALDSEED